MVFESTRLLLFELFVTLLAIVLIIYVYFLHSYQYWKNRGVPYLSPKFPYGNSISLIKKSTTHAVEAKYWYDDLKKQGKKFGGVWAHSRKVLVLVEPDYIKDVLTQDFQYFADRDMYSNAKGDPIGTHLFNIKNPEWKPLRQNLTPTFTSGKMKIMFNSIVDCSDYMVDYIGEQAKLKADILTREVLASFTTDVIGSVAFGIESNSFNAQYNEFREQARNIFKTNLTGYLRVLIATSFPDLSRAIGIKSGNPKAKVYFADLIKKSIEHRIRNNIRKPDFLQLLIDMYYKTENTEKSFSFEQIVANTILFFVAGFDTSSSTMTYVLYHLAQHMELQEKARTEINEVLKKHDGKLTYESLNEMTYLRQVIDESTRLYPPVLTLSRICVKDYVLKGTDTVIEKGTPVVISLLGLGRDPEYFPDPERFDPDRFTAENKAARHSYIHMPFGEGPRNCIGLRFGLMQTKIGLARILANFRLTISPKTKLPVEIDKSIFLLKEVTPIYLKVEKV